MEDVVTLDEEVMEDLTERGHLRKNKMGENRSKVCVCVMGRARTKTPQLEQTCSV